MKKMKQKMNATDFDMTRKKMGGKAKRRSRNDKTGKI